MVTRDVLKVLKLHSPTARAILRTFKTSLVPINHEMHSRSYDFLYLSVTGGHATPSKDFLRIDLRTTKNAIINKASPVEGLKGVVPRSVPTGFGWEGGLVNCRIERRAEKSTTHKLWLIMQLKPCGCSVFVTRVTASSNCSRCKNCPFGDILCLALGSCLIFRLIIL